MFFTEIQKKKEETHTHSLWNRQTKAKHKFIIIYFFLNIKTHEIKLIYM